ncbi:MAG: hypothetical protein V1721_07855 [Pseudomonadota bacterium]
MSQADPTVANGSGSAYRAAANAARVALLSQHKAATAPTYAVAGTIWLDDTATPWLLKVYDGADWITLGAIHGTTNVFTPYYGSAAAGSVVAADLDTDGTLSADSDVKVASQKAVKTYTDALIAANDAMVYKGVIDCSANPDYPAASAGHAYKISVAGKIGGASGIVVEVGDLALCIADGTSAGTQAAVGAYWNIIQVNVDGAVIGPASSTSGNIPSFNGTAGKTVQDSGIAASSVLTTAALGSTVQGYHANLAALAALSESAPGIECIDVHVSSAEILTLNATPVQLVAAPGANKFIMFLGAVLFLDYNSIAYAGIASGEDLYIKYANASGSGVCGCETTGFLDQASDQYRVSAPYGPVTPGIVPQMNAALVLHLITGEITTGNSPMGIRVYYRIVDISTLTAA